MGLESPLSHSGSSHTAWPMKAPVGLAKENPFAPAAVDSTPLSRSAVALSEVSSLGLNHVSALQSSPLNSRGYPTTTTLALGALLRIAGYRVERVPGRVLVM